MSVLSQPLVSMVTYDPLRVAAAAVLLTLLLQHVPRLVRTLWRGGVLRRIKAMLARLYMNAPGMRRKLEEGEKKLKERIQGLLLKHRDQPMRSLPAKGLASQEIIERLRATSARDKELWGTGKVSGGVYHGDEEVIQLVSAAMEPFLTANPLHPDLFPSVRQMESEIVQMTAELFHADGEVKGVLTSGGTESLIMMLFAYREWGREERGITNAEVIAPRSAHAALSKGAHYLGIRLIYVDVDPISLQASVSAMEAAITANTVALVCSVPSFPHGVIDPVQALGEGV
jgi:sphinganine-1-phosphate aldolase